MNKKNVRRNIFTLFQEQVHQILHALAAEYLSGLNRAHLLTMAPINILHQLIEERMQSIMISLTCYSRATSKKSMKWKKYMKGQFTVPFISAIFGNYSNQIE